MNEYLEEQNQHTQNSGTSPIIPRISLQSERAVMQKRIDVGKKLFAEALRTMWKNLKD